VPHCGHRRRVRPPELPTCKESASTPLPNAVQTPPFAPPAPPAPSGHKGLLDALHYSHYTPQLGANPRVAPPRTTAALRAAPAYGGGMDVRRARAMPPMRKPGRLLVPRLRIPDGLGGGRARTDAQSGATRRPRARSPRAGFPARRAPKCGVHLNVSQESPLKGSAVSAVGGRRRVAAAAVTGAAPPWPRRPPGSQR
jgi:hypothetical protein